MIKLWRHNCVTNKSRRMRSLILRLWRNRVITIVSFHSKLSGSSFEAYDLYLLHMWFEKRYGFLCVWKKTVFIFFVSSPKKTFIFLAANGFWWQKLAKIKPTVAPTAACASQALYIRRILRPIALQKKTQKKQSFVCANFHLESLNIVSRYLRLSK